MAGALVLSAALRPRSLRHSLRRQRPVVALGAAAADTTLLVVDPCSPALAERLKALGCEVDFRDAGESVDAALERAQPEVIIVRSSKLQASWAPAGVKLVMRAGAGVDNIEVEGFVERGVTVTSAAGANAIAVAELTMAHLLNLDRRLSDQVESLRRGEWRRLEFVGAKGLYGRTLAVLGVGNIGAEVLKRAAAFGMKILCWDKFPRQEVLVDGAVFVDTPEDALTGADAMAVHLPLTDETRGLVGERLLSLLSPGALVVNLSRGGIIDEEALLRVAEERDLRVGLDVFATEPKAEDRRFEDEAISNSSHVYGTHHTGARTLQAQEAVEDAVVRVVEAYLNGEAIQGIR